MQECQVETENRDWRDVAAAPGCERRAGELVAVQHRKNLLLALDYFQNYCSRLPLCLNVGKSLFWQSIGEAPRVEGRNSRSSSH